jgi:hypothetical protein
MRSIFREIQNEINESFDRLVAYADYYTEDLFRQEKDSAALLRKADNEIIACFDCLLACSINYPKYLSRQVDNLEENAGALLDIITLYAQNSKGYHSYQKNVVTKTFQYIRDYNGDIKITAKQNPPSVLKGKKRNTENFKSYDRKLFNSISRSKQKVYELARCNDWKFFVTFTINKDRYNRYDLEAYITAFNKWLSNYSARKTNGHKIDYIIIPELGKTGAWHLHGLINGLPQDHLTAFERGIHPKRLVDSKYQNWDAYERKFGYCSFGKIRNKKKVAGYITKYIRKSSITQERGLHSRLYYSSKGLSRSTEICRGYNMIDIDSFDFENEYVGVKWLHGEMKQ